MHTDHLGSVSLTTDAGGAVVSEQKYTAWGVVRAATGAMPTDVGYTGQRADASTGLMFYGARYYDAYLNRFISADSIVPSAANPQALNRYAYVGNNPLKYVDPSGHDGLIATEEDAEFPPPQCNNISGCDTDIPVTSAACGDAVSGCRMDIRLQGVILFYADLYGISPEMLETTLAMEAINDQTWYSGFADFVVGGAAHLATEGVAKQAGAGLLDLIEAAAFNSRHDAGIGMANHHINTMHEVGNYMQKYYGGSDMANLVKPGMNKAGLLQLVARTDGNIRYAAATLRMLADKRTERNESHAHSLSLVDEAVMAHP